MRDYFQISQNKYNPLLSEGKPIVVRICIDTKNNNINFDDDSIDGFSETLNLFAKKMSRKYKCVGIVNFNEVNFIFNTTDILKQKFSRLETQALTSAFSQEVFYDLNSRFGRGNNLIYTKVNVFNIFDNKVKSYISHRQSQGFNNYLRYCASKYLHFKDTYKKSAYELFDILKTKRTFSFQKNNYIKNGLLCKEGHVIDFADIDKDVKLVCNTKKPNVYIAETTELDDI